jgi:hypothetical protein
LFAWWKNREDIARYAFTQLSGTQNAVILGLSELMLKMVNSLQGRDFSDMGGKEWGYLFNTIVTKLRLLSGGSTENVSVRHQATEMYVPK